MSTWTELYADKNEWKSPNYRDGGLGCDKNYKILKNKKSKKTYKKHWGYFDKWKVGTMQEGGKENLREKT